MQDENEPVAEEETHRGEIDGRTRHQLSGLLVVEEAQLEALQLPVHTLAQVVFNGQRHAPGDDATPVHEPPARQHHGEDHQEQHKQRVAIMGVAASSVAVGTHGSVRDRLDRASGQLGQRDGHHHREAR